MEEIWKPIRKGNNLYFISNTGKVKSFNHKKYLQSLNDVMPSKGGRLLKPTINNVGYYVVRLTWKDGHKLYLLHRLIAEAFIPRLSDDLVVNHINGDKLDNSLSNLEWVTRARNNAHAVETGLNIVAKPIMGIHTKTGEVVYFESAREADRVLKIGYKNISATLNGKQHTCGGYKWVFVKEKCND